MKKSVLCKSVLSVLTLFLVSCSSVDPHYTITRDIYALTKEDWGWRVYDYEDIQIDSHGNVVSARCKIIPATMTFEYNEKGQMTKMISEHGGLYGVETVTFSYNEDGTNSKTHYEVVKDGKVTESYDEVFYYDGDRLVRRTYKDTVDVYEYDDSGRIIETKSTYQGADDGVTLYQYDENQFVTSSDRISDNGYHTDYQYDYNGNYQQFTTRYDDGDRTTAKFYYDKVGSIEESPETNPYLLPRDKWTYLDNKKTIPAPQSCVNTILAINDNAYYLLSAPGSYFFGMGEPTWFEPTMFQSGPAFTAVDQYLNILTDVCELEVVKQDSTYMIAKDGETIAALTVALDPNIGYFMAIVVK
ncbi:MAG: hypothetical protein E7185_02670 [Erysipelotrichaceae bacterium]|nr:hypothetical protein [Erysipelotrichaceae bacterium]